MGKSIECYIDCVSPYSFHAFSYLQKNTAALNSFGIEIEYTPVFLGGINIGSGKIVLGPLNNQKSKGNTPPWTLPAKAAYTKYDGKRAQKYFGHDFEVPSFFPILSLLVLVSKKKILARIQHNIWLTKYPKKYTTKQPQRALTYIKQAYPKPKYEAAWQSCFETMWYNHLDISSPENLIHALVRVFEEAQIQDIMTEASSPKVKSKLVATTEKVVKELGAFGCPWFWVTNGKGVGEPFFGSDRFHFMWDFLEVPHEDLRLVSKL